MTGWNNGRETENGAGRCLSLRKYGFCPICLLNGSYSPSFILGSIHHGPSACMFPLTSPSEVVSLTFFLFPSSGPNPPIFPFTSPNICACDRWGNSDIPPTLPLPFCLPLCSWSLSHRAFRITTLFLLLLHLSLSSSLCVSLPFFPSALTFNCSPVLSPHSLSPLHLFEAAPFSVFPSHLFLLDPFLFLSSLWQLFPIVLHHSFYFCPLFLPSPITSWSHSFLLFFSMLSFPHTYNNIHDLLNFLVSVNLSIDGTRLSESHPLLHVTSPTRRASCTGCLLQHLFISLSFYSPL